jgi:hypothetical protein
MLRCSFQVRMAGQHLHCVLIGPTFLRHLIPFPCSSMHCSAALSLCHLPLAAEFTVNYSLTTSPTLSNSAGIPLIGLHVFLPFVILSSRPIGYHICYVFPRSRMQRMLADDQFRTVYKTKSVALVRKRTIPTERPPHVGQVRANFCG